MILTTLSLAGYKLAFFMLQEGGAGGAESPTGGEDLSLWGMIQKMEWPAITVAVVLALMSMYSIAIMVERWLTYNAARNQSRQFAPKVAAALRDNRIDEAIAISDRHKKSHLAMVVNAGLQEFQAHQAGSDIPGTTMDAARRALQRATALKTAELKRGLSGLATIGSTAPFVGLLGTVIGIISAFQGMSAAAGSGISAVAGGISEALIETAFGLLVAIPAVWAFNIFQNKVEAFTIEMDNSSSELIDYFIKRRELR
ncbi:MAG TPA: MotA/TolQ/ExbB proton channel family protein [Blastocatellia bacterium]|jgi:biopolymer transport protein ExbB/biopolymer transport protein TolQ|nr:MotA/TolQ/ExbB proton channel family protein [Blastocatellia bacterium]